jgi:hypothetical protein
MSQGLLWLLKFGLAVLFCVDVECYLLEYNTV